MSSSLKNYYFTKKANNREIILGRCGMIFKSKICLRDFLLKVCDEVINVEIERGHKYYDFFCDMIDRHYELKWEKDMIFIIHSDRGYNIANRKKTPYRREEYHRCYVYLPREAIWRSFSIFNKCVNGRDDSPQLLKMKEYRISIEPQIAVHRRFSVWKCQFCDETKLLDVDHYPLKFSDIVRDFEKLGDDSKSFADYHREVAKYRNLCKLCHQKYGLK